MILRPLEDDRSARFAELFAESMPPNADEIYDELGLTTELAAKLPRTVGELRQIEEDGHVAGYVWLEHRERTLHIHALLLEEAFPGRGLGARVLAELENEFCSRIDDVELGVLPENRRAVALYERSGFQPIDERLGFLIMRKQL